MSHRDKLFLGAALGLTAVVALPLALLRPVNEERALFGILFGWGLALLIMVPSYVLLSRGLDDRSGNGFLKGFMLGSTLRLVLTVVGVLVFALRVERAPIYSFLMAYFLGYALLTTIELVLTVPRSSRPGSARPGSARKAAA